MLVSNYPTLPNSNTETFFTGYKLFRMTIQNIEIRMEKKGTYVTRNNFFGQYYATCI